ncbi:hypothetical protein CHRYSEO8AT_440125 [Chryseobacterium sp. 8AT]|nr:hypothetical protein CHRYSEO8AT_440125 [Chryseobacterium sp. 8AT]
MLRFFKKIKSLFDLLNNLFFLCTLNNIYIDYEKTKVVFINSIEFYTCIN